MNVFERLHRQLASAEHVQERAMIECRLALYSLRAGNFDFFDQVYKKHHDSRSFGSDTNLSLFLILLDGLYSYFRDANASRAKERVGRALRLAIGYRVNSVASSAAAWLAHLSLNSADYRSMIDYLNLAESFDLEFAPEVLCRTCVVTGDAYALAGLFSNANDWYARARLYAEEIGDYLTTSAIMHNRAAFALSRCRLDQVQGKQTDQDVILLAREAHSADAYETYRGIGIVLHPNALWKGRHAMLNGNYAEAVQGLERLSDESAIRGRFGFVPMMIADVAECYMKLGDIEKANERARSALGMDLSDLPFDDLAVFYHQCESVALRLGDSDLIRFCARSKTRNLEAFEDETRILIELLAQRHPLPIGRASGYGQS